MKGIGAEIKRTVRGGKSIKMGAFMRATSKMTNDKAKVNTRGKKAISTTAIGCRMCVEGMEFTTFWMAVGLRATGRMISIMGRGER